jgi:hypothetical protein
MGQIAARNPKDAEGYKRFMRYSEGVFQEGYLKLGHEAFLDFRSMLEAAPALMKYQAWRSVYSIVSSYIEDPHLREAFSFHTLLVGGNRNYSLALTRGSGCSRFSCAAWSAAANVLPNRTGEDPWVWQAADGAWHALLHDMSPDMPAGRHAFSRDGAAWTVTADLAYDGNVTFADGSRVAFAKRERPHLLLDPRTRAPLALATGVMQHSENVDDYSYTLVQAILA